MQDAVPFALLMQFLHHPMSQNSDASCLVGSNDPHTFDNTDAWQRINLTAEQRSATAEKLVAILLDHTMRVVQTPAPKGRHNFSSRSHKPSQTMSKDMILVWDLNSPPLEELARDKAALDLQKAAAALLGFYPKSVPHLKKQVSYNLPWQDEEAMAEHSRMKGLTFVLIHPPHTYTTPWPERCSLSINSMKLRFVCVSNVIFWICK